MKIISLILLAFTGGCAAYNKTGWWTPDTFNYTYATPFTRTDVAPPTHYFGLSWTIKDK